MLMSPETIQSVETETGHKRHILREGKRVRGPPSSWPLCLCNYLSIVEESVQVHDSIDEIDNLCGNCKKRMLNDGS